MKDLYEIFGLTADCTDEELNAKYAELRAKYSEDRFLEGEKGNEAASKLTELESAYREILSLRQEQSFSAQTDSGLYKEVEDLIKNGNLSAAQDKLDSFNERGAEWHYYQSVVFYKKNWINESKKQLEIAIQMDGSNEKYKRAYDKMCKQMNFNSESQKKNDPNWNKSGNGRGASAGGYEEPTDMMGGDSCLEFCARMAICNLFLNCCCNCR